MKNKIIIGIILGAIAGTIDVIPMSIQKLPIDADLSAFSMWMVIGFFLSVSEIKIYPVVKGILFSFLTLLPCAILIGRKEPANLIPISVMTLILGGTLGFVFGKINYKLNNPDRK
jgi:drug/metabolite transporter (DMT)-like permease